MVSVGGLLFLTMFLTAIASLAVSAISIILQGYKEFSGGLPLYILIGGYVALASGVLLLSINRFVTLQRSLASIPKFYIPIQKQDLPADCYKLIDEGFERIAKYKFEPGENDFYENSGYGRMAYSNNPINYKASIVQSFSQLKKLVKPDQDDSYLQSFSTAMFFKLLNFKNSGSLNLPINQYINYYEKARFGGSEISPGEYHEFIKVYALIVKSIEERFDTSAE